MQKKAYHMFSLLVFVTLVSFTSKCSKGGDPEPPPSNPCIYLGTDTCLQASKTTVSINLSSEKQTIHSFGASDCWTTKFIGKWANEQKKNQVADLLFSTDTAADGSPKGIALSLWRFNIGGGSFEQGDTSMIATDWRREECFLKSDGSYDWNKQAGARWFLQAAKQRNVKYSLGFSLTPPVQMTKNNRAFNGSGGTTLNIKDGKLGEYADFMAEVTKHFQFDYLSPVNEPQWTWGQATGASQEGTQALNSEVAELTKLLSQKLNGTSHKIVIGEAGQWNFLFGNNNDGRGDQVSQFFSPGSLNYVGNLPNVAHTISGHSYFTTCPDDNMINVRQQLVNKINQVDATLETWQTEFGILGNICNVYNGSPRNVGIDYGLYVAKVLHHDLAIANVSSWHWWLAVSPYNYSDALVYINAPSGSINVDQCKDDGIVLDSKQLWAFGGYARFIRPGMKRVSVNVQGISDALTAANNLMVSAYKDALNKRLVLVVINPKTTEKTLQLSGEGTALTVTNNSVNAYITDANRSMKKLVMPANDIKIPPMSIVTLTANYQ
jgi:hypothetical protein